jgi:hypothetical protein
MFNYYDRIANIRMMIRSVLNVKYGKIVSPIANLPVKRNDAFIEYRFQYFVKMTKSVIRKEK